MSELKSTDDFLAKLAPLPAHCRLDTEAAGRDQLGVLAISGADAAKFLQGQLTCDVLALAAGAQTLGASCTPQGRMRALFRLLRRDDDFLLLMPRAVIPQLVDALKKYAVFFKAQLRDASSEFQLWGILGATDAIANDDAISVLALNGHVSRHLLIAPIETPITNLPGRPADVSTWFAAECLFGEPAVYPETIEKLLPHHVNLPGLGGVSFSKGCYTGQEIVARMEYRGKIKTHLQLATTRFPGPIAPGCSVRVGERDVGEVVRTVTFAGYQLLLVTLSDPAQTDVLQLGLPEAPILELHR